MTKNASRDSDYLSDEVTRFLSGIEPVSAMILRENIPGNGALDNGRLGGGLPINI